MDKYKILDLVGEGSFGRVFRGTSYNDGGKEVALKLIPKVGKSAKDLSSLRLECKLQRELDHPNIVKMLDAFETDNEIVAVTEYISSGDLNKHFKIKQQQQPGGIWHGMPEERVECLAVDLISALHYLHSHRILHRDVKPQNILICEDGSAKLCDFGFARHLSLDTLVLTSIKGTPLYMAPELIEEKPYDQSADLWSVGCILYEMAVGSPPFATRSLFHLINKIRYEQIVWPTHLSHNCSAFLKGLLEKDPKRRLSWPKILFHPFIFQKIRLKIDLTTLDTLGQDLTSALSASQELAKEIQRQDKAKLLPGGSQTLIKVAERYEQQKLLFEAARGDLGMIPSQHSNQQQFRRHSETGFGAMPSEYNKSNRRHSMTAYNPPQNGAPLQQMQNLKLGHCLFPDPFETAKHRVSNMENNQNQISYKMLQSNQLSSRQLSNHQLSSHQLSNHQLTSHQLSSPQQLSHQLSPHQMSSPSQQSSHLLKTANNQWPPHQHPLSQLSGYQQVKMSSVQVSYDQLSPHQTANHLSDDQMSSHQTANHLSDDQMSPQNRLVCQLSDHPTDEMSPIQMSDHQMSLYKSNAEANFDKDTSLRGFDLFDNCLDFKSLSTLQNEEWVTFLDSQLYDCTHHSMQDEIPNLNDLSLLLSPLQKYSNTSPEVILKIITLLILPINQKSKLNDLLDVYTSLEVLPGVLCACARLVHIDRSEEAVKLGLVRTRIEIDKSIELILALTSRLVHSRKDFLAQLSDCLRHPVCARLFRVILTRPGETSTRSGVKPMGTEDIPKEHGDTSRGHVDTPMGPGHPSTGPVDILDSCKIHCLSIINCFAGSDLLEGHGDLILGEVFGGEDVLQMLLKSENILVRKKIFLLIGLWSRLDQSKSENFRKIISQFMPSRECQGEIDFCQKWIFCESS